MGMMPPGGQGGQQQGGQGGQSQSPQGKGQQQPQPQPASVPPEALMALLSFLMQKGGDTKPGEPAPATGTDVSQGSLTQILPMLMGMLSQNPQQAQGAQAVQQGQQQAQQPPEIFKMLAQLGLNLK